MFDFGEIVTLPSETDDDERPYVDGPVCEVDDCDEVIPWAGRGRKPKRCAEHKTRTSTTPRESGGTATTRRTPKQERRLVELTEGLTREFAVFGKGVAKLMPTAGGVALARAEITAQGLTALASKNPKLLAALEASTKILPVMDLGETIGMFGVAIMVDAGRMSPDGMMAMMLGVSEIYHTMHPEEEMQVTQPYGVAVNGADLFQVQVPPRFANVS